MSFLSARPQPPAALTHSRFSPHRRRHAHRPAHAARRDCRSLRSPHVLLLSGADSIDQLGFTRAFPMYVLPIAEVLALTKIRTHEELFDKLVPWSPGMGDCVFISQTWLGKTHPDPAGSKLQLLQQVCRICAKCPDALQLLQRHLAFPTCRHLAAAGR